MTKRDLIAQLRAYGESQMLVNTHIYIEDFLDSYHSTEEILEFIIDNNFAMYIDSHMAKSMAVKYNAKDIFNHNLKHGKTKQDNSTKLRTY